MLDSGASILNDIGFLNNHMMSRSRRNHFFVMIAAMIYCCITTTSVETGAHHFHLHRREFSLLESTLFLVHYDCLIAW